MSRSNTGQANDGGSHAVVGREPLAKTAGDVKEGKATQRGSGKELNLSKRVIIAAGLLQLMMASCKLRDRGTATSAVAPTAGTVVDKNEDSAETQAVPNAWTHLGLSPGRGDESRNQSRKSWTKKRFGCTRPSQ